MEPLTIRDLCAAADGSLYGPGTGAITAVSTDSRGIGPGGWFVPIRGERFDGHDFIDAAFDSGAEGCYCQRLPENPRPDKSYVLVGDTKKALGALAGWYRGKFGLPVVQITGSVGKTTTKELVAAVLSQRFKTLKTKANLNGDIGVPLRLLDLDASYQAAVIETGMDNFGQIRYLGSLVRPDIAVITNIGDAHMEFLGSRLGILRAKSEIFENLRPGGAAVLNGDDELLNTLSLPFDTLRCGSSGRCQVRVSNVEDLGVNGLRCDVSTPKNSYPLYIPAPGIHMAATAAIAVAVGERLGLSPEEIIRGVASYTPSGERMLVERLPGGRILLNDSYNANPQSMAAALRVLAAAECGRRLAMLGDMKELGGATEPGHREIGRLCGELGIDVLLAVGPYCRDFLVPAAKDAGCPVVRWYPDKEHAYPDLVSAFQPNSALLLKASHFAGRFDLVASYLRDYPFE